MRYRPSHLLATSFVALFLVLCVGCGSGTVAIAPMAPAKGKVTYKGKPLSVGTVRFEPEGVGRMASGKLQSDGSFEMSTLKEGDGAAIGVHRVYITGVDKALAKDRAFKKYMFAASSGLETEVSAEKPEHSFDLK